MGKIVKFLFLLLVFAFLALIGYSYVVDMRPPQAEQRIPVTLHEG